MSLIDLLILLLVIGVFLYIIGVVGGSGVLRVR
jgi:hypothetical protein